MLGKVLEGAALLNIDNVEQPLEGDTLNAVLTQERLSIRPLGNAANKPNAQGDPQSRLRPKAENRIHMVVHNLYGNPRHVQRV